MIKQENIIIEVNYFLKVNKLIFEGEYLNDKRNGIGKEYYNDGTLLFEGEYFKEERKGKGKEFFLGELVFEGEYLNDQKWNGKGKDYGIFSFLDIDHKCLSVKDMFAVGLELYYIFHQEYKFFVGFYEGELLNGKRNGKGKVYHKNGTLLSEGEYPLSLSDSAINAA